MQAAIMPVTARFATGLSARAGRRRSGGLDLELVALELLDHQRPVGVEEVVVQREQPLAKGDCLLSDERWCPARLEAVLEGAPRVLDDGEQRRVRLLRQLLDSF